jgi:hypothetical protein
MTGCNPSTMDTSPEMSQFVIPDESHGIQAITKLEAEIYL